MSRVSEKIRSHHRRIAEEVHSMGQKPQEGRVRKWLRFLKGELLPHARGEERYLYGALEPLLKAYGRATTTMGVDHEFIEDYVHQIEETAEAWLQAKAEEKKALAERLQTLALRLETLLQVHLEKEERVYLPLLERYLSEEEQERILEGMHRTSQEEL